MMIDTLPVTDIVRAVEGLGRQRDECERLLREARADRDEARKERDALNRQCANRERAIVALATAAGTFGQVAGPAPGASERDFQAALDALIAALKDPIVAECVAQAEADDAEARRDARRDYP